jgi:hypothetical protein
MISILATVLAGILILLITIGVAGGISATLVKSYVLPLFMSAFTLSIFWVFLFARHKGKLPILGDEDSEVNPAPSPKPAPASAAPSGNVPPNPPQKPT